MKKERKLDGVFFRIKRGDTYKSVCFSDLTEEERDKVLDGEPVEFSRNLCCILADTIYRIGEIMDITGDDSDV